MKLHPLPFPQICNQCDALFLQGFIFMYQCPLCFHRWAKKYICLTGLFLTHSKKRLIKRKGEIQHLEVNLICRNIIEHPVRHFPVSLQQRTWAALHCYWEGWTFLFLALLNKWKKNNLELLSLCKNFIPLSLLSGCFMYSEWCFVENHF